MAHDFASIGSSSCLRPLILCHTVVPLNLCDEAGGLVLVRGEGVDLVRSLCFMATGNSSSPDLNRNVICLLLLCHLLSDWDSLVSLSRVLPKWHGQEQRALFWNSLLLLVIRPNLVKRCLSLSWDFRLVDLDGFFVLFCLFSSWFLSPFWFSLESWIVSVLLSVVSPHSVSVLCYQGSRSLPLFLQTTVLGGAGM